MMLSPDVHKLFELAFLSIRAEAEYMSNLSEITRNNIRYMLIKCENLGIEMEKITHNLLIHTRWSAKTNRILEVLNVMGGQLVAPGAFNLYVELMNEGDAMMENFVSTYKMIGNYIIDSVDDVLEELGTRAPSTHAFQSLAVH